MFNCSKKNTYGMELHQENKPTVLGRSIHENALQAVKNGMGLTKLAQILECPKLP